MSISWLLASKLSFPTHPAHFLPRDRLLGGRRPPAVTVLVAGPGAGKTQALLALADRVPAKGRITLWYALDDLDADPATFFQHLLTGVRQHIPAFAPGLDALAAVSEPVPRTLWTAFFGALIDFNLPGFLLVLDDVHHLSEPHPEWLRALAPLLERLPPEMTVLLASRRPLPLPTARLSAAGRLAYFDATALRFDDAEVEQFLRQRAPDAVTLANWQARAAGLDGWPLALELVTHGLSPTATDELAAYVGQELFETQPPACQQLMCRLALLRDPSPELLRAVLPEALTGPWLAHLEAHHLLTRLDGGGFRYPAYLREFLQAEARERLPLAERQRLHGLAATFMEAHGRDEEAVSHWLAAESWDAATTACLRCVPLLAAAGRYEPIERWLAAFPAAHREGSGHLWLWQGHVLARRGDNAGALEAYEIAGRRFRDQDDPAHELRALVRHCTILAYAQETRRLSPLLLRAQALLSEGLDADRADLWLIRALLADHRGDLALMQECNEAILALLDPGVEVATAKWIARTNLHTLALNRGELDTAERHVREAIALAVSHGFGPYELYARFLLANLQLLVGDVEPAVAYIQGLPGDWADRLEWQDLGCALAIVGHAHQARGAWREAEEALARSRATFEHAHHPEGAKVPIERQAWLAIARHQPARALALCAEAGAGESLYDAAIAIAQARATHLAGSWAEAWTLWEPLIPGLDAQEARLHATRARLYATATLAALGQTEAAKTLQAAALQALEAWGYGFLRAQDPLLWNELSAVEGTSTPPTPAPTPNEAALEIRCFGTFEVLLDGRRLEQWPRRKAKLVLATLALADRDVDTPGLAEALDEPMDERAGTSVRMAVMALRRVLEPALGKGEESSYVRSSENGYGLVPARLARVDVRDYSAAIAAGRRLAATDAAAAAREFARALELYRAPLLEESLFAAGFEIARQRMQQSMLDASLFLHQTARDAGDNQAAEQALRQATLLAPCEEEPYLELMRFFRASGRPERIRQLYWDHRKALKARLGITPGEAFEAAFAEAQANIR